MVDGKETCRAGMKASLSDFYSADVMDFEMAVLLAFSLGA